MAKKGIWDKFQDEGLLSLVSDLARGYGRVSYSALSSPVRLFAGNESMDPLDQWVSDQLYGSVDAPSEPLKYSEEKAKAINTKFRKKYPDPKPGAKTPEPSFDISQFDTPAAALAGADSMLRGQRKDHKAGLAAAEERARASQAQLATLPEDDPRRAVHAGVVAEFEKLKTMPKPQMDRGYAMLSSGKGIFHQGEDRYAIEDGKIASPDPMERPGGDYAISKTPEGSISFNDPASAQPRTMASPADNGINFSGTYHSDGTKVLRKHLKDRRQPQQVTF
jgi:hypothetical protein